MEEPSNIYLMLGRLEGKVDALLSSHSRIDQQLSSLDSRVTDIEALVQQKRGAQRLMALAWGAVVVALTLFTDHILGLFTNG